MRNVNDILSRTAVLALAATLAAAPTLAGPATAGQPSRGEVRVAASTLGDLSPYRTIAADTLAIVGKGDMTAARARVKDLETAWDKAEASLKPKDAATWTAIDGKIDAALTDLRTPNPKPAACEASLRALIAEMDRVSKA